LSSFWNSFTSAGHGGGDVFKEKEFAGWSCLSTEPGDVRVGLERGMRKSGGVFDVEAECTCRWRFRKKKRMLDDRGGGVEEYLCVGVKSEVCRSYPSEGQFTPWWNSRSGAVTCLRRSRGPMVQEVKTSSAIFNRRLLLMPLIPPCEGPN
jgi:hypothetical protein